MGLFPYISMATMTTFPGIGEKTLLRPHAKPKHPKFNISAKQNLPLPDNQIGTSEPPLFSAIMHGHLCYYYAKK